MSLNSRRIWELLGAGAGSHPDTPKASPTWKALEAAYRYNTSRPPTVTEATERDPEHRLSRLSFRKPDGQSFSGLLMRPQATGMYPCVLLLHALSSDKDAMIRLFGRPLAERGLASLALDAHLHGERRSAASAQLGPMEYLKLARESIVEYRQALDYLKNHPDVDSARVGLLGYSLGAMMGSILAGVDERVQACVFMVGGDMVHVYRPHVPVFLRGLLEPVSPANFVARISPRPVFFINGTRDATVPREAATHLHEAAGEPKRILWADAGHILPPEVAAEGVDWLREQLI